jgi:hypothetical protein
MVRLPEKIEKRETVKPISHYAALKVVTSEEKAGLLRLISCQRGSDV